MTIGTRNPGAVESLVK